jgi:hypothetical protein
VGSVQVVFPKDTGNIHYYNIHYRYLIELFKYAKCNITYKEIPEIDRVRLLCYIDNKEVVFDFSDNCLDYLEIKGNYFKFHYSNLVKYPSNIKPFSPISLYNWTGYYDNYSSSIKYQCNSDIILCNQRPYGNALNRRSGVFNILKEKYGKQVDTTITSQVDFWNKVSDCLVYVHVPGFNNNMIDRTTLELMFLGCCMITPSLPEKLPYDISLLEGVHYIKCNDNYSDLIDQIEWCKLNRDKCIEIGNNAKTLCNVYLSPERCLNWIKENL